NRQLLLLAAKPIGEIPEPATAWGEPQLQPAAVRQLHQPLARLGVPDGRVRKFSARHAHPQMLAFWNRQPAKGQQKGQQILRLSTNRSEPRWSCSTESLLVSVHWMLEMDAGERRRTQGGAARGIRTPDPVITNDVLYQLSYCGGAAGK